jgi:hypothetical protein
MNNLNNHPFFTFKTIVVIMVLAAALSAPALCLAADSASAKLDNTTFTARGPNETLLHIEKPGCFCIGASSKQGTQVTIVDRMSGPYQSSGSPGASDGRLDLILDKGSYKIRLNSHPNGSGEVKLEVFPYREAKDITGKKGSVRVNVRMFQDTFKRQAILKEGKVKSKLKSKEWQRYC